MHRTATVMILLAALLAPAAVQGAEYQLGLKAGLAVQTLDGDALGPFNVENRTGFVGGGFFQGDFNRHFGLRLEALYYMKGASGDSADIDVTIKLNYIEFPVLLMGHMPLSETARLSVFGGPTFAFNTSADAEASFGGFSGSVDISDGIKSFDFGLAFGAALGFDVGRAQLGIDGRYTFGLDTVIDTDFANDQGISLSSEDDVKNQGFAFMAFVGFPVGSGSDDF